MKFGAKYIETTQNLIQLSFSKPINMHDYFQNHKYILDLFSRHGHKIMSSGLFKVPMNALKFWTENIPIMTTSLSEYYRKSFEFF